MLIKLDSTLYPVMVQVYDGGENEGCNAIDMDINGNIYIGGWTEPVPGRRDFLLIAYDNSGSLLWEETLTPDPGGNKTISEITSIAVVNNSLINVTGFATSGTGGDIVTAQYDLNGDLQWAKSWSNLHGSINYPSAVNQFGNDIYVTGRTENGNDKKWVTIKYAFFERDTAKVYNIEGKPVFLKNELIVRFNPSAVNHNAVDNTGNKIAEFGDLDYFLTPSAVSDVQNALLGLCPPDGENSACPVTMVKIFRQLKTTDTVTTSRLGEQIPVPSLWSAFSLVFPDGSDISEIADSLNALFPLVLYVHGNYIATPFSTPNDTHYPVQQASLHPTSIYPTAHINVEPAWEIETGKPFVKIGIFDDGIYWKHEDFGYNGSNPASSRIVDGWNFQNNTPLKSTDGFGKHGTPIAGIIGAIRNNNKGIAGIAGGNDSANQQGVSMYGLRIFGPSFFNNELNYVSEAILGSAIDDSNADFGYGLHIMNHSWGFYPKDDVFNDSNVTLLREAVHFANRTKVTFVAARGHLYRTAKAYPAVIDEDWVLCVGATDNFGDYDARSNYGPEVDIAAPGHEDIVFSTDSTGGYESFSGTSAAAPHVAGVAGLLMSYLNSPTPSYDNLAPEDVEYIIQMTARAMDLINDPQHNTSNTGHGLLDAGAALQIVNKNTRKLMHYNTSFTSNNFQMLLISSNDTIVLSESCENASKIWFKPGKYVARTYKINSTVTHNIPTGDSIVAYWPRHSSSNQFPLYDSNKVLLPRERITINSLNHTSASLTGYVYRVSDTLGNFLGWLPSDNPPQFAYSVLLHNPQFSSVKANDQQRSKIFLFPNPTSGHQTLSIISEKPQNLDVRIYDVTGRMVKEIYSGKTGQGEEDFTVNLQDLSPGIYLYRIMLGEEILFSKIIKN
jgi:hypothetical protein